VQLRQDLVRNLRPDSQDDGLAVIQDGLICLSDLDIRKLRSKASSDDFIPRREEDGAFHFRQLEAFNYSHSDRASSDKS
jgi:hypothetical protein